MYYYILLLLNLEELFELFEDLCGGAGGVERGDFVFFGDL